MWMGYLALFGKCSAPPTSTQGPKTEMFYPDDFIIDVMLLKMRSNNFSEKTQIYSVVAKSRGDGLWRLCVYRRTLK